MRWRIGILVFLGLACAGCSSSPIWSLSIASFDSWSSLMLSFRVAICVLAAIAVVPMALFLPRRGIWNVVVGSLASVFAFVLFLSYFDFFNPNVRYDKYYHRHEFFHGFVGAKYFNELGYERLYACSIVAQAEFPMTAPVTEARDMRDRVVKLSMEIPEIAQPELCKRHFTPERWSSFVADIEFFAEAGRGSYFANMHKDAGYTETPLWTLVAKVTSAPFEAKVSSLQLLSALDPLFQLAMLALTAWAFGWRIMLLATVFWAVNAASPFYWTGGAYLHQLWLLLLMAAVCLAKKRFFALGGASLTASVLLNPWVAPLLLGFILAIAGRLVLRRPLQSGLKRFGAGAVVAFAILFTTTAIATRPSGYDTYLQTLAAQNRYPVTNQVGLAYLLSHDSETRMERSRRPDQVDQFKNWRELRLARMSERRPLQIGFVVLVGLATAWALARSRSVWPTIPVSFALLMSLISPTCFHYSMAVVMTLAAYQRPVLATFLLLCVGTTPLISKHVYFIDDRFALMTFPLYLAALVTLCAWSWSWSRRSLKAMLGGPRQVPTSDTA